MSQQRSRVLLEPDSIVAQKLRAAPETWHVIAVGEADDPARRHTLCQVAMRIRQGKQRSFRTETGEFEATVVNTEQPDRVAPVELRARYVAETT